MALQQAQVAPAAPRLRPAAEVLNAANLEIRFRGDVAAGFAGFFSYFPLGNLEQ